MFKSKFVFAVSFVALFAVGSAWAADSDAGIAGVSYVERLLSGKQDKLVPETNIKGAGSVSVSKGTDGVITISGTDNDTKYTLPDATNSVKGGVIVGTNISVSNGKISVADATQDAKGVGKLYAGTGDGIDGSMTQKAITSALGGKVDKNQGKDKEGSGLVVGAQGNLELVDVATQNELDTAVEGLESQIEGISGGVATDLNQFKSTIAADIAAKVSIDQTESNANKAMITDDKGQVKPGQIATGMIVNSAVTVAKTSGIYGYIPIKADGSGAAQIWVE